MGLGGRRSARLLIAQTAAAGSDTDAQEHALDAVRAAFAAARPAPRRRGAASVELRLSGPGVFSVAARANIQHAVVRLSIAAARSSWSCCCSVYRSPAALLLGLLPVATGALVGVAAVALGFGAVHGITLGFGVTLIGESVDYSIYFFIQSRARRDAAAACWQQRLWPTMRLGMLTSVCGFASLLPSGFPGLAQLGVYSICGLIAAAAVTRFVLPELAAARFQIRDLTPLGAAHRRAGSQPARRARARRAVGLRAGARTRRARRAVLRARPPVESRALELEPDSPAQRSNTMRSCAPTWALPMSLDLVVVPGASLESVLRGAERAAHALAPLVAREIIGGFDSPATTCRARPRRPRGAPACRARGAARESRAGSRAASRSIAGG